MVNATESCRRKLHPDMSFLSNRCIILIVWGRSVPDNHILVISAIGEKTCTAQSRDFLKQANAGGGTVLRE
jgi:hypothetical protein